MPKLDGTGPQGQGLRTGRGMGPCGCGSCGEGERGKRKFLTKEEETEMLKEELKDLESDMKAVKERLEELK